jgi:hypothetical protein
MRVWITGQCNTKYTSLIIKGVCCLSCDAIQYNDWHNAKGEKIGIDGAYKLSGGCKLLQQPSQLLGLLGEHGYLMIWSREDDSIPISRNASQCLRGSRVEWEISSKNAVSELIDNFKKAQIIGSSSVQACLSSVRRSAI